MEVHVGRDLGIQLGVGPVGVLVLDQPVEVDIVVGAGEGVVVATADGRAAGGGEVGHQAQLRPPFGDIGYTGRRGQCAARNPTGQVGQGRPGRGIVARRDVDRVIGEVAFQRAEAGAMLVLA